MYKVNANTFHVQNVEESIQRVTVPPPKRKPSKKSFVVQQLKRNIHL